MKTKLLLFASVLFMLWSCEEGLTGTVDTDLEASSDATATETAGTNKAGEKYFEGTMVLDFEKNEDVKKHINDLQDLDFNGVSIVLEGENIPLGVEATGEIYLPEYNIVFSFNGLTFGQTLEWSQETVDYVNEVKDQILKKRSVTINYLGTITGDVPNPFTFKIKNKYKTTVTFKL